MNMNHPFRGWGVGGRGLWGVCVSAGEGVVEGVSQELWSLLD